MVLHLCTKLRVHRPFCSGDITQTHFATLTFDLEVTVLVGNVRFLLRCLPILKFVGLPTWKILCIYCVSINRPGLVM